MTDFATAKAADGPGFVQWLEDQGLLELANQNGNPRRLREWRSGGTADFFAVDRMLLAVHLHPIDVPDELWRATSTKTKRGVCLGCGETFESAKRGEPQKWCSAKCRNAGVERFAA